MPWCMRPYSRDPQWSQKVGLEYVCTLNLCLLLRSWREGQIKTIYSFNYLIVYWIKHFDVNIFNTEVLPCSVLGFRLVMRERKRDLNYVSDKKPSHTVLCSINRTIFMHRHSMHMHKQTQILYFPSGSLSLSLKVQRKGFILKWLFHWEPIS